MEKSKSIARANWKGSGDKSVEEKWFKIREELNPTEFLGYEFDKAEGVVIKISKDNKFVDSANNGDQCRNYCKIKHLFMESQAVKLEIKE